MSDFGPSLWTVLLLAIDPGNVESAFVIYDTETRLPAEWAKRSNEHILHKIDSAVFDAMAVEMVASYGMAVGATVFETCVWAGRFIERAHRMCDVARVYRKDVKLHLCGTSRAKDTNVRQAIIDRYGSEREVAIGRKASPGPLYGIKADCWAALGVAITAAEGAA